MEFSINPIQGGGGGAAKTSALHFFIQRKREKKFIFYTVIATIQDQVLKCSAWKDFGFDFHKNWIYV